MKPDAALTAVGVASRRRRRLAEVAFATLSALLLLAGCTSTTPSPIPPPPSPPPPDGERDDLTASIPHGLLPPDPSDPYPVALDAPSCLGEPIAAAGSSRRVDDRVDRPVVQYRLYLYPDISTAQQVFTELTSSADATIACAWFPGPAPMAVDRPEFGDEAFEVTIPVTKDGAGEHVGQPRPLLYIRAGRTIIWLSSDPGGPTEAVPLGIAQMHEDALTMVARTCLYDPQCEPGPRLPRQLNDLRNGGTVWAAVLGTFDERDPKSKFGEWVAGAAELGYHAQTVTIGCDVSMPAPPMPTGQETSYVAVYFASEGDAQSFADVLPNINVAISQVTTYCV